jgi:uncharacterized protein YjiS (DUF1127 family)
LIDARLRRGTEVAAGQERLTSRSRKELEELSDRLLDAGSIEELLK